MNRIVIFSSDAWVLHTDLNFTGIDFTELEEIISDNNGKASADDIAQLVADYVEGKNEEWWALIKRHCVDMSEIEEGWLDKYARGVQISIIDKTLWVGIRINLKPEPLTLPREERFIRRLTDENDNWTMGIIVLDRPKRELARDE